MHVVAFHDRVGRGRRARCLGRVAPCTGRPAPATSLPSIEVRAARHVDPVVQGVDDPEPADGDPAPGAELEAVVPGPGRSPRPTDGWQRDRLRRGPRAGHVHLLGVGPRVDEHRVAGDRRPAPAPIVHSGVACGARPGIGAVGGGLVHTDHRRGTSGHRRAEQHRHRRAEGHGTAAPTGQTSTQFGIGKSSSAWSPVVAPS